MGITRSEALDCLQGDDLIGMGMEADAVRRRLHPDRVVTYAIGSTVGLGDVLTGGAHTERASLQIGKAVEAGAVGICMQGCFDARPEAVLQIVSTIRGQFPELWLEARPSEVLTSMGYAGGKSSFLSDLRNAGLDGIGAEDAGMQDTDADIIGFYRAAHKCNLACVANVRFGVASSVEHRIDQLVQIYELQGQTGAFHALAVSPMPPSSGRELDGVTAVEMLKMLATARMFLDNIPHLQAMYTTHGLKVLQTSLRFGANDVGWVPPLAGDSDAPQDAPEEDIRRIIRDAGFLPVERDARYTSMFVL